MTLFCYNGSAKNQMTTMMHELGHNLALEHGGDVTCNWKSNYNSIMNYRYQWPGIDNTCDPDPDFVYSYSVGNRITIDENHINENLGTCGIGWAFDWNLQNGLQSDIQLNLNDYGDQDKEIGECGAIYTVLNDHDDWANLELKVLPVPISGGGAEPPTGEVSCPPPPQPLPFVFGTD